jgi:hypothetical protein
MAILKPHFRELTEDNIRRIVAIGREQVGLMDRLEEALKTGDTQRVVEAARKLVGLEQKIKEPREEATA